MLLPQISDAIRAGNYKSSTVSGELEEENRDQVVRRRPEHHAIGPDVIIETAGAPGTALDAANWVRRCGRVVIVGFSHEDATLNFGRAHMGEKTIMGSSATSTGGYQKAANLIASGAVCEAVDFRTSPAQPRYAGRF